MTPRRMIKNQNEPGSQAAGEPGFVVVGKLRRAHGVRGEMVMELSTDFPERLVAGKVVYLGDTHQPIKLRTVRDHDRYLLVSFVDRYDPDAVSELRNALVSVRIDSLPELPEGEYYHHQLIGLLVKDEAGQELGQLTSILETGSNDVYIVTAGEGKEILLPALVQVILGVDLEKKEMLVRPPEWE